MDRINLLKSFCYVAAFLVFGLSPLQLYAYDDLNVEGISHDAENPQGSIVVINGTFLKEGDVYQNYKILKIGPNSVHVADTAGGSEEDMYITGGQPASTGVEGGESSPTGSQEATTEQKLQQSMTNPFAILGLAREVGVLADLKQIHMASAAFFAEYEMSEEIGLEKLVERGLISRAFESGVKGGYRFSVKVDQGGVAASADPVNDSPSAKHFYIDGHGVLFEEIGKPATDRSRPKEI